MCFHSMRPILISVKGAKVKVKLEGLDEKRGQLSMTLLGTSDD